MLHMSNLSISHPEGTKRALANGSNPQLEYSHNYSMDNSTVRFDVINSKTDTSFTDFPTVRPKESPISNDTSSSTYRQQMPNINLQNNLNAGE